MTAAAPGASQPDRFADEITVGALCLSRQPIMKLDDEDRSRLCRVIAVVPSHRWRDPAMPEYKVELLAAPVVAFRRASELDPVR